MKIDAANVKVMLKLKKNFGKSLVNSKKSCTFAVEKENKKVSHNEFVITCCQYGGL